MRCIASDPIEDTERRDGRAASECSTHVASPPIRLRILKVHLDALRILPGRDVASPPIRLRILKVKLLYPTMPVLKLLHRLRSD